MAMMAQQRFLTFISYDNDAIQCLSNAEFGYTDPTEIDWSEFVWQFAVSKEQAIEQHLMKMDEWQENPNRETY